MNFSEIRSALDQHLNTGYSTTEIGWDNMEYQPGVEFIRPALNIFTSENATIGVSLGNGYVRHEGVYLINIYIPLQTGSGRAYQIADIIETLFGNKYINGVFTETPTANRVGDNGTGYFLVSVLIPFKTDNTGS